MKDTILLISAMPYRITDEKTGAINEGVSLGYIMTPDASATKDERGFLGYRVLKGSVKPENLRELTAVPGFYDAEFEIKADASGKAVIKPVAVKYKKALV